MQKRFFISLLATVYVAIALFGVGAMLMPSEHGDMLIGGCPLMGDTGSLCQKGILDHINHWNMLFATIGTSLIVVFAALVAIVVIPRVVLLTSPPHERYRRYAHGTPHVRLFQPLVLIFSSGIVQPKLFS
ncbi:MAG: hypothetical protein AAB855_05235 [Patescibacteria group bacterium]